MIISEFVDFLGRERALAILRTDDLPRAKAAMEAAARGGFRVLEFTMSIPGVFELVQEFAARDDIVVGVGTVLTHADAVAACECGASFLVSPVVDEPIVRAGLERGVAVIPGTHTPTEMLRAYRAGAPLQKLFPAPAGGPAYVRSVLGPMPFLRLVPTNGVTPENAREWLEAGAYALGFTRPLFSLEDLKEERWDRIEARAREILVRVRG